MTDMGPQAARTAVRATLARAQGKALDTVSAAERARAVFPTEGSSSDAFAAGACLAYLRYRGSE